MEEEKNITEQLANIDKDLYRMNGTLMAEGELGKEIKKISQSLETLTKEKGLLEKINWNLGNIAQSLKKMSETGEKIIK